MDTAGILRHQAREGNVFDTSNDTVVVTRTLLTTAADEIERLRAALEACESWIDRWTKHVGACEGGDKCTCGRSAILYEAHIAIAAHEQ